MLLALEAVDAELVRVVEMRYFAGYSETEIILAYGACSFSSKMGQLAGNHFLTIVEGREKLRELGRKVLWEGAQDVLFEAV